MWVVGEGEVVEGNGECFWNQLDEAVLMVLLNLVYEWKLARDVV